MKTLISQKLGDNMKKIGMLFLSVLMAFNFTGCAVRRATTEQNNEVHRIISTSAPLCEMMDELELDLVGIPKTNFEIPARYRSVTEIGMPMAPDLEIVKSLNPTDIITPNSLQYDLQPQYESIGVPATFVNLMSIEGMFKSIEGLGKKYNRIEQANKMIEEYKDFMNDYTQGTEDREPPKVLILMGLPGAYVVATEKSYVGSLVKLAGAVNVFQDEKEAFLNLNTEAMLQTEPDIILRTAHAMPEMVMAEFEKDFRENDIWQHFRAVQEGKVYDLDYTMYGMSANLNYQKALKHLQKLLYE
jgi:iron complex transport system substrate-binding protein